MDICHGFESTNTTYEARMLTEQLALINMRLQDDSELARQVPFSIRRRGECDTLRLAKLWDYRGPDRDTMHLLQTQAASWYHEPYLFWCPPLPLGLHGVEPHVELVSRILQLRHADT